MDIHINGEYILFVCIFVGGMGTGFLAGVWASFRSLGL